MIQKLLQACTSISDGLAALLAPLDTMKFTIHRKQQTRYSQMSKDIEVLLIYLFFNTHFKPKVAHKSQEN